MKKVVILQRLLGALIAYVSAVGFIAADFKWYWLFITFLLYDISMVGYLSNNKLGAKIYNFGHGFVLPALLLYVAYRLDNNSVLLFISLSWLFHIGIDRAFGFGLKKPDGFKHTDLGDL